MVGLEDDIFVPEIFFIFYISIKFFVLLDIRHPF